MKVDNRSCPNDKIQLFRSLFRGRGNVHSRRFRIDHIFLHDEQDRWDNFLFYPVYPAK